MDIPHTTMTTGQVLQAINVGVQPGMTVIGAIGQPMMPKMTIRIQGWDILTVH